MKTKNFLFTAVLTFGAILFATNVSAQTAAAGEGSSSGGENVITGNVDLVLQLKDFQELKVNGSTSRVVFTFDSRKAYFNENTPAVASAPGQLTVFSTKQFNINVEASKFTNTTGTILPDNVLDLFIVKATKVNHIEVEGGGKDVPLSEKAALFTNKQKKTTIVTGYDIDIDYRLNNPSKLYNNIGDFEKVNNGASSGIEGDYTSIVTYTIVAG